MKKSILNKILLAVSCIFLVLSCEDREIVTVENQSAPEIVGLSASALILDSNFTSNPALTVTWNPAEYSVPTEISYELEAASDAAFTTPYSLSSLTQSVRYVTFTTKDINTAAGKIGLAPDVVSKMYLRVTAYLANKQIASVSNITSLDITPYQLPFANSFTPLYLIGDATAAGWSNAAGNTNQYPLMPDSSSNAKYVFTGYFKTGGFKIVPIKGNWDKQYGLGTASSSTSGTLLKDDGGSGNIPIDADGYYKLTIDVDALTYTIEAVTPSTTSYTSLGLIGSATANGWDNDTSMTQSTFDTHVWILENVSLTDGEVKFRANGTWDVSWGLDQAEYGTASSASGSKNIPVSKSSYNVYFNDSTGDYIFLVP